MEKRTEKKKRLKILEKQLKYTDVVMLMNAKSYTLLPSCSKYASSLIIVATCDGASNAGQIGNEVARILTKSYPQLVRMCCLSAVASGSQLHLKIFHDAKAVVAINGCPLKCASNVLRKNGIEPTYEVTITELGISKEPTLDFDSEVVHSIADKISKEFLSKFKKETG